MEEKIEGKERINYEERQVYEIILATLIKFGAQVAIPSFLGKFSVRPEKEELRLRSILFIGAQKSDRPYTQEDIDLFYMIAQESAIAIENARLFDEAIHRSKELVDINEQLTDTNEKLRVTQASLIVAEKMLRW